jgi:hypothetical protein
MRFKRKDTQLLVEGWRRLINEGSEKGDFTEDEIAMVQKKVDELNLSGSRLLVKVLDNKSTGSKHLCLRHDQGNSAPIQLFRMDKNSKGGMDRYEEEDSLISQHDTASDEYKKALIKLKNDLKNKLL